MRHMGRTHGVALSWLSGEIREKRCELGYIKTSDMAADIFTKFYPREKKETWRQMCGIICVFGPDDWDKKLGTCGIGHATAMERMKAKQPKFNDPIAAIEEYDSTRYHKYRSDYNPFQDVGWDDRATPSENPEFAVRSEVAAAVAQEDEVSLLQPETVRRLSQWIRMVTEQGTTATSLQRRKLSNSVLSQKSSEKIRKVSVALNVYHNQGSTSAWLQTS